ncbi:hypothetical protein AB0G79_33110 [Streptomyces sp. NPDC020807]|uniref:hypothetical protein n=1 Tax=Streptomyces sp. NPDC020807 TaxID=3155119 RepID=UPI0033CFE348
MPKTDPEIPVSLSKEDDEESGRKSWLPAWVKFPKWTPTALIWSACFLSAVALATIVNFVTRVMLALHESSLPWWGLFFVYSFIGGALFRASKEFAAWYSSGKSRWGVFTRWAKGLV